MQARLSPLPPHAVADACNEWVQQLAQDCAARCPSLLQVSRPQRRRRGCWSMHLAKLWVRT